MGHDLGTLSLAWRLSIAFLVACACCGQVNIDSGEITGTAVYPEGGKAGNVVVTASDSSRGFSNVVATAPDGSYRLQRLPPGHYQVRFEATGRDPIAAPDVEVQVGQTRVVNATIPPARSVFKLTVNSVAPPIDFERSSQADQITSLQIERLPINRRDYLDFALLSPGITASASTANSFDYRQTSVAPTSGLSFAGSNGRGNTFAIDGIENNGITGNVRLSVPQSAVQEFQVNQNGYGAEYGGAYGGATNIVSKSGTNEFHGEFFGYLRQTALEARNYFDPGKSGFTREQSGAAIGGPVRKDRTFWFSSFERLDRHESFFVPIFSDRSLLTEPSRSQQQIINALASVPVPQAGQAAALMLQLLTPARNPGVTPLFASNSGSFPFSAGRSSGMLRIDHRRSDQDDLFVRLNLTSDDEQNTNFGALNGRSRGYSQNLLGGTAMLSYTHRFNPDSVSVTRVAFAYDGTALNPTDPNGPAIDIAGFGYFGRQPTFPFRQYERHFQLQQSFELHRGRHDVRFGVDLDPVRASGLAESYFGGRFTFSTAIPLATVLDTATQNTGTATTISSLLNGIGRGDLAQHLADPISSLQAFSLGLPVAYFQGFGNPDVTPGWEQHYSAFVDDVYRLRPGLVIRGGLRFQTENNVGMALQKSIDPRFGFSWSPASSDSFSIHGAFGTYHAWTDSQIVFIANAFKPPLSVQLLLIPITGAPGITNPLTGQLLNSADLYNGLLASSTFGRAPITLNDLAPYGVQPGFQFPGTGGVDPAYRSPYSEQGTLEVQKSYGDVVLSASYLYQRALHLPRSRDHNLYLAGTRTDGSPIFGRTDPAVLTNDTIESTGNLIYNALVVQAQRRFRKNVSFNVSYTFSKAIDDVTDFDIDDAPNNQLDIRADRGLSLFNQKHRVVGSAVLQSSAACALLRNWTFSTSLTAYSFMPFNVLTGYDNLGDGQTNTHRPWGTGRNVGIGPGGFSLDGRLSRSFILAEKLQVQIIGEGFNLTNHTNFATVNNIVGPTPLSALPRPIAGHASDPSQPLSFTSANDPREFQLGLRIVF